MSKAFSHGYSRQIEDAELRGRVLATLARDSQIKSDDLRVILEGGGITLLGTVHTPYERHRAEHLTKWATGVRRVDNRMAVAVGQYVTDDELAERVRERLAAEPRVSLHDVGVVIQTGVVTLVGRVNRLAEERAAVRGAERAEGVRDVISAIRVGQIDPTDSPFPIVDDAALLSEVNAAIEDAGVTIYQNESYVRDGRAYLHGLVADPRALQRATRAAQDVPGLQRIRNGLALQASSASRDPDEALVGRIVQAFHDDGRVSPSQVVPSASDGVVVLGGGVDSIEDHDAALAIAARVSGVRTVMDSLRILGRSPLRASDREGGELRRIPYERQGP
ncbi:MAG: BON domain-containing protein [Chloroflexi bacterium]|nr:BON domain-containing protein [Chloroflexota bacterium]